MQSRELAEFINKKIGDAKLGEVVGVEYSGDTGGNSSFENCICVTLKLPVTRSDEEEIEAQTKLSFKVKTILNELGIRTLSSSDRSDELGDNTVEYYYGPNTRKIFESAEEQVKQLNKVQTENRDAERDRAYFDKPKVNSQNKNGESDAKKDVHTDTKDNTKTDKTSTDNPSVSSLRS